MAKAGDVNGDTYDDVIMGAPEWDNGETDEGKVFLFHGSATGPASSADWTLESNQANAKMGWNGLGQGGDTNGDGNDDLMIGVPLYDNGHTNEGIVYLYLGTSGGSLGGYSGNYKMGASAAWEVEADATNSRLGVSTAMNGDVDGDGFNDGLMGAQWYDNTTFEGAVFQYYGDDGAPMDYRAPLPIKLIACSGYCNENYIFINWETASETNNDFYTIERSNNGSNWEIVGTEKGAGNSNSSRKYSKQLESVNGKHYYRLKQTDYDGKFEYFKIFNIDCADPKFKDVVLYPNPSNGRFTVTGVQGDGSLVIYNALGETIFKMISLSNTMDIDLSNYPKGNYNVVITTGEKIISKKIVITR